MIDDEELLKLKKSISTISVCLAAIDFFLHHAHVLGVSYVLMFTLKLTLSILVCDPVTYPQSLSSAIFSKCNMSNSSNSNI